MTDAGAAIDDSIDFEKYSIQDALTYQKNSGIGLQAFTDGIANKMKFQVSQMTFLLIDVGDGLWTTVPIDLRRGSLLKIVSLRRNEKASLY